MPARRHRRFASRPTSWHDLLADAHRRTDRKRHVSVELRNEATTFRTEKLLSENAHKITDGN